MLAWVSVGVVVVVVAVIVVVGLVVGGSSSGAPRETAPADAVAKLSSVPVSSLATSNLAALTSGLQGAGPGGGPPLVSGGMPQFLYIGAEFCPICAAERWPMFVALSKFGTFSNVSETHSALRDGDIATLSFFGSTYSSKVLRFSPVETTTNQPQGDYYKTLETPTKTEQAVWSKYDGSDLSFPFVDIGGRWVLKTAQYSPGDLSGVSFSTIVKDIGSNDTRIGAEIDASAGVLVKYICSITGNQPSNVCSAVSSVQPPGASSSGPSSSSSG
jgi:Domain of unknown function (DUF929)